MLTLTVSVWGAWRCRREKGQPVMNGAARALLEGIWRGGAAAGISPGSDLSSSELI